MKKLIYILPLCALFACNTPEKPIEDEPQIGSFAKGGDLGWLTEQEADGVKFYNDNNEATDCIVLLRSIGMNSVRLRVWVNHSTGWCNKQDVIIKARRAKAQKQRIMIDFHYSDFFCDPGRQDIPAAWKDYTLQQMQQAIAEHTTDVLSALQAEGITPEWIQVGNETTNGMLWRMGQLWDNNGDLPDGWKNYAALSNAGYDAAKAVFPEASVIIHIDNAWEDRAWWYTAFRNAGGKFDMIGLSHYPQTNDQKSYTEMNTLCAEHVQQLAKRFGVPVMIAEVGTKSANPTLAAKVMQDFIDKVCGLEQCAGVFYWEPQVYNAWRPAEYIPLGWGAYDMGAFTAQGKPAEALKLLFGYQSAK